MDEMWCKEVNKLTFIISTCNSNLTFVQNEVEHITSALNERNTVIGGIYRCGIVIFACFQQPLCQLLKKFQNLRVSNIYIFGVSFHNCFLLSLSNQKVPSSFPQLFSVQLWNIHSIFFYHVQSSGTVT